MPGVQQPSRKQSTQSPRAGGSSSKIDSTVSGVDINRSYWDRLRQILSDEKRATSEKIHAILRLGTVRFGVENGYLTRIDPAKGTHTTVEVSGPHPEIDQGTTVDLAKTYCRKVIAGSRSLSVYNAPKQGWVGDPAYETTGFACYHGAKVVVGERLYGTVCFADREPLSEPLDEANRAFLDLIAQGIGRELERGRRKGGDREAERQVKRTERLLFQDLDGVEVGGWELDVETQKSSWTEAVCRICGLSGGDDLDLETVLDRIHTEARGRIRDAIERAVQTKEPFAVEAPVKTVQEEQRWIELHGIPRSHGTAVSKIVGTIRDVTDRRRRRKEIRQSRRESIDRLARVAEHRHYESGVHTRRVGRMSRLLAEALGQPSEWQERIREAAPLHDIGKIGIPDEILLKPDSLSAEEYETMKEHTLIGANLLSGGQTKLVRMAEQIARSHHERWDGTGYPTGLKGKEIPLSARIVAVADAFDAMTHDRPYQKALSKEEAFSIIEEEAGTQFDPQVSGVALRIRETLADLV